MLCRVTCAACGCEGTPSEMKWVREAPSGKPRAVCLHCRFECDEPTLPNAQSVLFQLRHGHGVGA